MNNKTPNCNMHEALVAYLYGEATTQERDSVSAHLTECAACKLELESFERVRGMLQQWQLDDLPVVRVVAQQSGRRSMLAVLKELVSVTPIWAKALGAVAMAMLVLAVIGTDVRVGQGGFSFRADLLRRGRAAEPINLSTARDNGLLSGANIEQVRTDVRTLVNQLIADNERRQKEELRAELVTLESQLKTTHSSYLARLTTQIQEHQQRLKTLEQDIDRREGLDLTDILFSEVSKPTERPSSGGGD